MALMEISRSRFKQSKNSTITPVNLCCGVFCEFLGLFGRSSFSKRIGKIKRIRNIEDLVVLKLESVVNN